MLAQFKVLNASTRGSQTKKTTAYPVVFFVGLFIATAIAFRSAGALFAFSATAVASATTAASFFVFGHIFKLLNELIKMV
jgi:hypothetical protein